MARITMAGMGCSNVPGEPDSGAARLFAEKRPLVPPESLQQYEGLCIAWSPDMTVIASAETWKRLEALLSQMPVDTTRCTREFIRGMTKAFRTNREKISRELAQYRGKWIALSLDGSNILAVADNQIELHAKVEAAGTDPEEYHMERVPDDDAYVGAAEQV